MTLTDIFIAPPPFLLIFAAALLIPLTRPGSAARVFVLCGAPLLALARAFLGEDAAGGGDAFFSLLRTQTHGYSPVFGAAFCIALACGGLYASRHAKTKELVAAYVYGGAAIGAVYAADLAALFVFWEIMAIGATFVIAAAGTLQSARAAKRYAYMHFFGGVMMMSGIAAHYAAGGSLEIAPFAASALSPEKLPESLPAMLMLAGILVNLAAPPFSAWLPDAYPSASVFGTVFLSTFTTKTAVFVVLTLFPGAQILLYIGMAMVFYGIIMAILENDMRRILAYSVVNQVGFMVTAVGIGSPLALLGAAAHAFCHIAYKSLLFMSAGVVLHETGESRCSRLGGLYKAMPVTCICGIIGALAISAFPFTSGFVSKSLIASAAGTGGMLWVWLGLIAASAGVFLHAGIKFPWFVFFQKDSGKRPDDAQGEMKAAMLILSALCIIPAIPGVTEYTLYALLPAMPQYNAYSVYHVLEQLELLLFSGAAFFVMLGWLRRTETLVLDIDWLYRRPLFALMMAGKRLMRALYSQYAAVAGAVVRGWQGKADYFRSSDNVFARNWSFSDTFFWSVIMLCGALLLNLR